MTLETALEMWTLRDRTTPREGVVRASFRAAKKRWAVVVDLNEKYARIDRGDGSPVDLLLEREASDPGAWTCSCPLKTGCLHAGLAAAALTREVEASGEDDVADPRFVHDAQASEHLIAAAERSLAVLEKVEDSVRIGDAVVEIRVTGRGLGCDCPMREAPTCLHRVVVDAWARGIRPARPTGAGGGAPLALRASSPDLRDVAEPQGSSSSLGEALPEEDVVRFEPVLRRVEGLVAEIISHGLQRTSGGTLERIHALITTARALGVRDGAPRHAGLGRVVRTLERLVQIVGEFQERIVTTTELDVMRELAILRNIWRAIRSNTGTLPLSDFAGATQQEYVNVAAIDVQGIGFEAWVTTAGFGGVTAFLANLRNGQILTRTNAMPLDQLGGGSWQESLASQAAFAGNSLSFLQLSRGRFLLSGAQVAPDSGRLSGSGKTQIAKRDVIALDDAKLRRATLVGGADAARIVRRLGFDPLGRPPTSPPIALVPVKEIGEATFDRRTQTLSMSIVTPSVTLPCSVGYRDSISMYIDNLEKLAKAEQPPQYLLCRVRVDQDDGVSVQPITAYFPAGRAEREKARNLTFKELDT